MMGKLVGGLAVSLTGSLVYVIGGVLSIRQMGVEEFIPYHVLPWFFTFMILNIVMLGALLAALGSVCNDAKDAQQLTVPAMLPVLIPMFIMVPVLREPSSTFATTLSFFPPFTPMLMLLRQSTPAGVPLWQPWLGLIGVVAFALLSVWAGGRVFRAGILFQGQRPKLTHILRWAMGG
jgi:ABC-2 type transport system permease protein